VPGSYLLGYKRRDQHLDRLEAGVRCGQPGGGDMAFISGYRNIRARRLPRISPGMISMFG